eukprot:COSAG02_NODE_68830_length_218_cov_27.000000_1_plen_59_part_10
MSWEPALMASTAQWLDSVNACVNAWTTCTVLLSSAQPKRRDPQVCPVPSPGPKVCPSAG